MKQIVRVFLVVAMLATAVLAGQKLDANSDMTCVEHGLPFGSMYPSSIWLEFNPAPGVTGVPQFSGTWEPDPDPDKAAKGEGKYVNTAEGSEIEVTYGQGSSTEGTYRYLDKNGKTHTGSFSHT
ncbi:MAG: hypothetical protein H6831_00865 [Planctomycetes bacterium]|nr:hypothetical protein [Planctomycetota bacterium]